MMVQDSMFMKNKVKIVFLDQKWHIVRVYLMLIRKKILDPESIKMTGLKVSNIKIGIRIILLLKFIMKVQVSIIKQVMKKTSIKAAKKFQVHT
jgi:hypothetical protein